MDGELVCDRFAMGRGWIDDAWGIDDTKQNSPCFLA